MSTIPTTERPRAALERIGIWLSATMNDFRSQFQSGGSAAPAQEGACKELECHCTTCLPTSLSINPETLTHAEKFAILDRRIQTSVQLIINEDQKIDAKMNSLTLVQGLVVTTMGLLVSLPIDNNLRLWCVMCLAGVAMTLAGGYHSSIQECLACLRQHKAKLLDAEKKLGLAPQLELKPQRLLHKVAPPMMVTLWGMTALGCGVWLAIRVILGM